MRALAGLIHFNPVIDATETLDGIVKAMTLGIHFSKKELWSELGAGIAYIARTPLPEFYGEVQPRRTNRGGILVTVARILNREALARAFNWPTEETNLQTDDAFVLAAYDRWGESCTLRLDGDFSIAVWEPHARRLFCAVDPKASRPIYYRHESGRFAFASTLRGLFALPGLSRRLNEDFFADMVANIPHDSADTLYRAARRIPSGHSLTVDPSGIKVHRYWNPQPPPLLRLRSEADYVDAMHHELTAAVRRTIRRTPGNVGLFLSGGLDSSTVAVIAGRLLSEEGRRLQAIHIIPRKENRYRDPLFRLEESHYVRLLQSHAPEIDFHFEPETSTAAPREAWDEHFADHLAPFTSLLRQDPGIIETLRRHDLSLVLDGIGGNHVVSMEALASGYLEHLAASGQWGRWWRETLGTHRVYGLPLKALIRHTAINPVKDVLRGGPASSIFLKRGINMLNPAFRRRSGVDERFYAFHRKWYQPSTDFHEHLHSIVNVWAAMAFGTPTSGCGREPVVATAASPLFDRRLNEFCLKLPLELQVRDGWDRRMMREAMRGLLPEEVRLRTTRGFLQPEFQSNFDQAEPMLREELDSMETSPLVRELLDYDRIKAHWQLRQAQPTLGNELSLVKAIATGAFLRWHEKHGA